MIGKSFSHYIIQEKLGEGGMGVVYKAQDTSLDRTVALKFLSPHALITEESKTRFAREAKSAASLMHPNVATIFEYGEADDPDSGQTLSFIAMEYVAGQTLTTKIDDKPLPLAMALDLAIAIAEGLSRAHEKNITHRDIKSDNIMVASDGTVKVMDFGLADIRGNTKVTREGTTVGTISYMSPEQAQGEKVDQRSDLWSYGVVLYEVLSGTRPFKAAYEQALIYQILNEEPESLTNMRSEIPSTLNQVVQKLLQKNPTNRYQTMTEALTDLKAIKKSLESGSEIPAFSVQTTRWQFVNIFKPAGIGLGVICLIALMIWYLLPESSNPEITSLAVLPFENITHDPDQAYFADGMTDQLISELCKIKSLRIASRTSAMQFKGQSQSLQDIARILNVDGVITATVFRSGERMRLNASLTRASDDKNLWNDSYERKIEDVLNLTATLAQSIAKQISVTLTADEQKNLAEKRPVDPEAFDLVARANFLISSSADEKNLEKALELMFRAVQIDPNYVGGHVGVAWALTHLHSFGYRTGDEVFTRAKAAIDKAMEMDPELGLPYALLAKLLWTQNDFEGSIAAYARAVELSPNDGLVRTMYSWGLMVEGRFEEGVRQGEIAVELDPLSLFARCNLTGWYYTNHQFSEALTESQRILDLNPRWIPALAMLRQVAVQENRLEDAVAAGRNYWLELESLAVPENISYQEFLQWEANTLEGFASKGKVKTSELALCYAEIGNLDKAMEWLKIAEEKDDTIIFALFYPEFNSLRGDPRFEELVAKKHFPVNVYCNIDIK